MKNNHMNDLKFFFAKIENIVRLDAECRKGKEERGELFNVFEVLKLQYNETRTHSAFLAALLTPKGKHGAGDRFLRAFIDTMGCLKDFEFDTKDAKVEIEYSIGNKNENATEGGRIDILIESADRNKAIIIENKIYAGDQEKQLVRYANYAKNYSDYRLLYLNLFGSEASEYSVKDESDKTLQSGEDYFQVSYDKEIIDWLEACIAEAARLPIVRESIIQYQNLIKTLTNQSMEKKYDEQMLEMMTDHLNLTTTIASNLDRWRTYVVEKYIFVPLKEWAEKEHQLELMNELSMKENTSFSLFRSEWEYCRIAFSPGGKNRTAFKYGILLYGHSVKEVPAFQNQQQIFQNAPDPWWPYGRSPLEEYTNWTNDAMQAIVEGKVLAYLKERIEYVLKQIETHKLAM